MTELRPGGMASLDGETPAPPFFKASSSWPILASSWANLASDSCLAARASSKSCLIRLVSSSLAPELEEFLTRFSIRGSTSIWNRLVALKSGS